MRRLIFIFATLVLWFLPSSWGGPDGARGEVENDKNVGDRLIIELNQYSFTQRQMEIYLLIRSVLTGRKKGKWWLVSQENWQKSVGQFRHDMMIFLETRRLGRFQPQNKNIQQNSQLVLKKLKSDRQLESAVLRLGIDRWTSLRTIVKVMQVDEYQKLKSASGDPGWLRELEKKYVVRRFRGTGSWIRIQPTLGRQHDSIE